MAFFVCDVPGDGVPSFAVLRLSAAEAGKLLDRRRKLLELAAEDSGVFAIELFSYIVDYADDLEIDIPRDEGWVALRGLASEEVSQQPVEWTRVEVPTVKIVDCGAEWHAEFNDGTEFRTAILPWEVIEAVAQGRLPEGMAVMEIGEEDEDDI